MKLPPIPRSVPSPLGPLKVRRKAGLMSQAEEPCCGIWHHHSRTITIDSALEGTVAWQTLLHELVHVALGDAGIDNHVTEAVAESVCDSVATLLTTALRSGTFAAKSSPKKARSVAR